MASADPISLKVWCPSCRAEYRFPASMAGRNGRCAACGAHFTVPTDLGPVNPSPPQSLPPAPPVTGLPKPTRHKASPPKYASVACRICQTRLSGLLSEVGRELKCPDCGARTVLPPQSEPPPSQRPAAMDGEQYELWEADVQPLASELLAAQPKYIAISCRLCDTLLYATEAQVGEKIACPDCGSEHVVPSPRQPIRPPITADAYDLDASAPPPNRPPAIIPPRRLLLYEEEEEAERARAITEQERDKKHRPRLDAAGRPVLPPWPLITGILPFLFTDGTRGKWFALSVGLMLAGGLLLGGLVAWGSWQPRGGDFFGGMKAIAGVVETVFGLIFGVIWLAAAACVFLAVVTESSAGRDRILGWPTSNFIDTMTEFFQVAVAVGISACPGWALVFFLSADPLKQAVVTSVSLALGFPIVSLSQLAGGSAWSVANSGILASMVQWPFTWAVFYFETLLLAAACALTAIPAVLFHPYWLLLFAPLYVGAMLIYGRLLGRLAWRISVAPEN